MATFPSFNPIYGASKSSKPATRTVKFGDGYEQRVIYGLPSHMNAKEWSLTFDVSDADADTIETFLNARAEDSASFDWSPPDTASTYKWVCSSWNRQLYDFNRSRIEVTFRQVFEP